MKFQLARSREGNALRLNGLRSTLPSRGEGPTLSSVGHSLGGETGVFLPIERGHAESLQK
jgi:hypothetical protein